MLYPIVRVAWLSFTDYHYLRVGQDASWVGLSNYALALADPLFLRGLLRAVVFTLLFVPGMILLPLIAAVLIDRIRNERVSRAYRLLFLVPAMIPGPLVFVLWTWMYNPTIGPVNYVLVDVLGIYTIHDAPRFMGEAHLLFPAISVMHWWWGLGLNTVLFLVGLSAIPKELIEAARVDSANEWQVFRHVTLPLLKPILLVLLVIRFGASMAVIEEFLIFGGFSRQLPTYTWTVYMWDLAFRIGDWNQGYAAAVGWIGAIVMIIVVIFMFRFMAPRY